MASTATHDCDVLIIGAGVFGTSTAYHLSRTHPNPSRITVLDRARVPSPSAASSDINKIVRTDYSKSFYMDLAYEALEYWTDPEQPTWQPFFHQTGWVMIDDADSDLADRIRQNFRASGRPDPSSDISHAQVTSQWGGVLAGIDLAGCGKAYTNSTAGWADASSAVAAMMGEALRAGVQYEVGEVSELLHDGGAAGITAVRTTDGRRWVADQILLATGAWTPWLMAPLERRLSIPEADSVQRQIQAAGVCVATFRLAADEARRYGQMPVLIYGAKGEVMPPTPDGLFKFTNAHTFLHTTVHPTTGQRLSVPSRDQGDVPPGLKEQSLDIIRQRIPQMVEHGRTPEHWRLCWDAVSPDQNQLITAHPDARLSNLYLATAGSFHSWKFLPNIGRYVVNVLAGRSNGKAKDAAWAWKTSWDARGAHEKVAPQGELAQFNA